MKIKRIILVISIILLFSVCLGYMNHNFDRLSRYPYENKEARALIDRYLNDDEIEYIIEYSIAPYEFIDYIKEPKFNIYHTYYYREVKGVAWYLKDNEIVDFCEDIIKLDAQEEALSLLDEYYYNEVLDWIINHDIYNKEAKLIDNPNSIEAYLDENYTVGIRSPYPLISQDVFETLNNKEILIKDIILEPLENLYKAMKFDLGTYQMRDIYMSNGYISYDEQKSLYEQATSKYYPGHNEHQLGLAVDLNTYKGDFKESKFYAWLKDNAHKYGFILNRDNPNDLDYNPGHIRFVGYDLAQSIYDNHSNLKKELSK